MTRAARFSARQRAKAAATEQARKTVEEGDRRRAAAEAVVAELKTQRDDTVAEMERLRSELLSTISKHTTRSAPEPRNSEGRRKRANIAKAPAAWIEGQIAQLSIRPGATVFLTLRDPSVDMSVSVTCSKALISALPTPPTEGSRVVVHGQFEFYAPRGSLSFRVDQLHPVGLGELLARLERLRRLLAADVGAKLARLQASGRRIAAALGLSQGMRT